MAIYSPLPSQLHHSLSLEGLKSTPLSLNENYFYWDLSLNEGFFIYLQKMML